MAAIEFDERDLDARVPDLAAGGAWTRVRLRWRRDPLTGASARILTGVKLQPDTRPDLTDLIAKPAFCPFDSEHLEKATVPFPAELTAEGRIRVGQAVVVPNVMAYATYSAVGIYDPGRHFLDLDELTPSLVGDALTAMIRHARRCAGWTRRRPGVRSTAITCRLRAPRWSILTCNPRTTPAA